MSDAAAIAAGLTPKAKHILRSYPSDMTMQEAMLFPMVGIVERCSIRPSRWKATPLGLAVRAHLNQEQPR